MLPPGIPPLPLNTAVFLRPIALPALSTRFCSSVRIIPSESAYSRPALLRANLPPSP